MIVRISTVPAFTIAITLLLGACSGPTLWESPGVSTDNRSLDIAACHSYARDKAEESFANEISDDFSIPQGSSASLSYGFKTHDARKKRASLFSSCMKRRGYSQTVKEGNG